MPRRFENLAMWFRFTRRAEVAHIARDENGNRFEMGKCGRALWPGVEWFGALHSGGA
jgi:hypothetical protein